MGTAAVTAKGRKYVRTRDARPPFPSPTLATSLVKREV
jgi:hypothetical protein